MDKWEEKQKKYLTFFENNALIRKAILNTHKCAAADLSVYYVPCYCYVFKVGYRRSG